VLSILQSSSSRHVTASARPCCDKKLQSSSPSSNVEESSPFLLKCSSRRLLHPSVKSILAVQSKWAKCRSKAVRLRYLAIGKIDAETSRMNMQTMTGYFLVLLYYWSCDSSNAKLMQKLPTMKSTMKGCCHSHA
jgi:hypothetical protein